MKELNSNGFSTDTIVRNLDHFAFFYAKTMHQICECLIYHVQIPRELFTIRTLFVEQCPDIHMDYMNAHLQALFVMQNKEEDLTLYQTNQIIHIRDFFMLEIAHYDETVKRQGWPKL